MTGGKAAGGAASEGEVGVGGEQESGEWEFFEKMRLLDSIGTTEGDQGVGAGQLLAEDGCGLLVKAADGGSTEKGRTSEMDLFPEAAQGGGGVQGGGGEFGTRPLMSRFWMHGWL